MARLDKNRVMAWDWTFNRDKSVSVCKLVGGDRRIDEVETRAEEAAMKLLEEQITVKVRKASEKAKYDDKFPERKTGNILYVRFRHPASREGDPHSHTHYVIYNLTHDPVENCIKAVNFRHVDRRAMGKVYQDTMRKGLNELGYKTRLKGNEVEIVGFPAEVKAKFSTRHNRIEEMEREYQEAGKTLHPKGKQKLSLYNRPEKEVKPLEERVKGWLEQLSEWERFKVKQLVAKAKHVIFFAQQKARAAFGIEQETPGIEREGHGR